MVHFHTTMFNNALPPDCLGTPAYLLNVYRVYTVSFCRLCRKVVISFAPSQYYIDQITVSKVLVKWRSVRQNWLYHV